MLESSAHLAELGLAWVWVVSFGCRLWHFCPSKDFGKFLSGLLLQLVRQEVSYPMIPDQSWGKNSLDEPSIFLSQAFFPSLMATSSC